MARRKDRKKTYLSLMSQSKKLIRCVIAPPIQSGVSNTWAWGSIERPNMILSDVYRIALEYGKNWSGPGRDVTGPTRARSDLKEAHLSNFLHPVVYCFRMPAPPADGTQVAATPGPWSTKHITMQSLCTSCLCLCICTCLSSCLCMCLHTCFMQV